MRWMSLLSVVLVAVVSGCGGGKSSERKGSGAGVVARAARVDMKEGGFNGATVNVVIVVDNQSGSPVTIQGASIQAAYAPPEGGGEAPAGAFEGAMQPKGKATVDPGTAADVPVELTLTYPSEPEAFKAFIKAESQNLKVTGSVQTSAGELQVDATTDFPTPRLLVAKVKDAQISSIDDGAAGEVELELQLTNPNAFQVKAEKWSLRITIDGKQLKETDVAQGETLQPNAGVAYNESFKIDAASWGPDYKAVLKKSQIPYEVAGVITVGTLSYPVDIKGTMKFHR